MDAAGSGDPARMAASTWRGKAKKFGASKIVTRQTRARDRRSVTSVIALLMVSSVDGTSLIALMKVSICVIHLCEANE